MKNVSLQEFYDMLESHDWYWIFADNSDDYHKGQHKEAELESLAKACSPEHYQLIKDYHEAVWSGPGWNTPKHPKPLRPE